MSANWTPQLAARESPQPVSAEERLQELGIRLPAPPQPFGTYVEAVQTGSLLFLFFDYRGSRTKGKVYSNPT
jgi:hypothetical protein